MSGKLAEAVFGGGCFWCMQPPFDQQPRVIATDVGYMGGHVESPTVRAIQVMSR